MAFSFSKKQIKTIEQEIQAGFLATGLNGDISKIEIVELAPIVIIGISLALMATDSFDVAFVGNQQFVSSRRKLFACMRAAIDGEFKEAILFLSQDATTGKANAQIRSDMALFCRCTHLAQKK
jgi:hypothetical protein